MPCPSGGRASNLVEKYRGFQLPVPLAWGAGQGVPCPYGECKNLYSSCLGVFIYPFLLHGVRDKACHVPTVNATFHILSA